jgi:alpha-L-fucosidase
LLNTGSIDGKRWIPAEVDVSIRPGWFYHANEDDKVKSAEQLFDIYLSSVGRGSTLLLNIPPDQRGLFHERDVEALRGYKKLLDTEFAKNLAFKANIKADSFRGNSPLFAASNLSDGNKETYWATNDGQLSGSFELDLGKVSTVKYVTIQEYIKLGQRVKKFTVEAWKDGKWTKVADGTTIGYKRIFKIDPVQTSKIRVTILDSKACPAISNVEVY